MADPWRSKEERDEYLKGQKKKKADSYMQVQKYYAVMCEKCGRYTTFDEENGISQSRVQAVKRAVKEGFQVVQGRTLCRKCAENVMYNKIE